MRTNEPLRNVRKNIVRHGRHHKPIKTYPATTLKHKTAPENRAQNFGSYIYYFQLQQVQRYLNRVCYIF